MIAHCALGETPFARSKQLRSLIGKGEITCAGNRKLKIYGTLSCASGKRMKVQNRVFFASAAEAIASGFRPCGHCMRRDHLVWKGIKG